MVHLVGPSDRTYVGIVTAGKPFETLVDDHVMDEEVGKTVSHDAEADRLLPPDIMLESEHDEQETGHSENEKESIVLFKKTRFHLVMIPVQVPEEPMHDPFVGCPGNAFHEEESTYQNQYIV
jgi:hypothetical protein